MTVKLCVNYFFLYALNIRTDICTVYEYVIIFIDKEHFHVCVFTGKKAFRKDYLYKQTVWFYK